MATGREWDVVVVGGVNTDFLARGPALPAPGEPVQGDIFQEAPGGKGANQAVAAARLGARVTLIARVGADRRGNALLERLSDEKVDTRYVLRDPEAPTGAAVIQLAVGGEKQILAAEGANRRVTTDDVRGARTALQAARVLVMQVEVPLEAIMAAARIGRESGTRVVLDPAPPMPVPAELYPLLDLIRPNTREAEALTGVHPQDRATARKAAEILLAHGSRAAAVQAATAGDLVVWQGGERWLPRLPVDSVDTTGAGDAFVAALAVMLAEGRALPEAASFANAAAALATTKLGAEAALPPREAVIGLLEKQVRRTDRAD